MADEVELSGSNVDVTKMKVFDLKRELRARGLNTNGNKLELAQRLSEAMQSVKNDDGSDDSVEELIDEDDVLNEEEIEQEVGDIKNIHIESPTKTFDMESSSNSKKVLKRKNSDTPASSTSNTKPAKKIVLNRELSTEEDATTTTTITTPTDTNGTTHEKKIVKLSELSVKERLAMRAKKFGVPLSAEAKKYLRAQRFGGGRKITLSGNTKISLNSSTEEEIEQEVGDIKNIYIASPTKTFDMGSSSNSEKVLKRKNSDTPASSTSNTKPAKKIVLNRELSTEEDATTTTTITTPTDTNGTTHEKKIVKLSELSVKERLAMRAKKFGVPFSAEAKKYLRAQRFGGGSKITLSGNTKISLNSSTAPDLDVLKKRALRFGTVYFSN